MFINIAPDLLLLALALVIGVALIDDPRDWLKRRRNR